MTSPAKTSTLTKGKCADELVSVVTDAKIINPDERRLMSKAFSQLEVSCKWSGIEPNTWQPWFTHIHRWFNSSTGDLTEEDGTTVRNILHTIATEDDLGSLLERPCPFTTILCVLRVAGLCPLDVSHVLVEQLPAIVRTIITRFASLTETPLSAYRWVLEVCDHPSAEGVLSVARSLREKGLPNEARELVSEVILPPEVCDESKDRILAVLDLLEYDYAKAVAADVFNQMRNASADARRMLIQQVLPGLEHATAIGFIQFLLADAEEKEVCEMGTITRACAVLAGSEALKSEEVNALMGYLVTLVPSATVDAAKRVEACGSEEAETIRTDGGRDAAGGAPGGGDVELVGVIDDGAGLGPGVGEDMLEPDARVTEEEGDSAVLEGFFEDDDDEDLESAVPTKHVDPQFMSHILRLHRQEKGKKAGQPLLPDTITDYVQILKPIPTDIFPCDPDQTLDHLEKKYATSTVNKTLTYIGTFMKCFERLGDVEKQQYFGSLKRFRYARAAFHDMRAQYNERENNRRGKGDPKYTESEEAKRVDLEVLEKAYAEKVISGLRRMVEGTEQVERWYLQRCILIALYQERPPTRSLEYALLKYLGANREGVSHDTNYVSGDRLVIQRDKVSGSKGTFIYDMTGILQQGMKLLIAEHTKASGDEIGGFVFQKRNGKGMTRSGFKKATYSAFGWLVGEQLGCRILRKIVQSGLTERGELMWPQQRDEFWRLSRHSGSTAANHYIIRVSTPQEEAGTLSGEGPTGMVRQSTKRRRKAESDAELESDPESLESSSSERSELRSTAARVQRSPQKRPKVREQPIGMRASGEDMEQWGGDGSADSGRADWSDERMVDWFKKHLGEDTMVRGGETVQSWKKMANRMNEKFGTALTSKQLKQYHDNCRRYGKL